MYKKILVIIEVFILLFTLSGCYSYVEIQSNGIVTGVAIDKGKEQKYKVTVESISVKSGKDAKAEPVLLDEEGETILEAMRKMISIFGKKIYVGHAKVIIISEELATEGISEIIEFFMRDPEFRSIITVFISKGTEASKLFDDTALFMDISSYEIDRLMLNDEKFLSFGRRVQLYQAANTIMSRGTELTLPILELKEVNKKKTFSLNGLGLFKGDKFQDILEGEKVKYFLSFVDEFVATTVSIKLKNGAYVSYELSGGKSKTKIKTNKDRFEITINFKVNFNIESVSEDENGKKLKPTDFDPEKELADYWKKNMLEVFDYIKTLKIDAFGFGRLIMGQDFKKWSSIKDKENILDKIDIKINIQTTNDGSGKIK